MQMKEPVYGNGIDSDFEEALSENAIAKARFEGLTDADKNAFLQRVRSAGSKDAMKPLLDELVGWQKGHAPYEL